MDHKEFPPVCQATGKILQTHLLDSVIICNVEEICAEIASTVRLDSVRSLPTKDLLLSVPLSDAKLCVIVSTPLRYRTVV